MNPIKVAICDDNLQEREFFKELCQAIRDRKNVPMMAKVYDDGKSLLFDIEDTRVKNTIDIILLDINMPGDNGIEVARKLRERGYQGEIIFLTKSNEHWRDAFGVRAFNYITKDDDLKARFMDVFMEAARAAEKRRGQALLFSSLNETRQIEVASISYFKVDGYLIKVYYDNDFFEFTSSMAKIEELLFENEDFMRIHRSYFVSVSHIKRIDDKIVIMDNGNELPVSHRSFSALKAAIAKKVVR